MQGSRKIRIVWVLFGMLAGCSPYNFQKDVTAFSTGVDQVSNAFASGYVNLAADQEAQTQLALTNSRATVLIAPSCGIAVGSTPQSQLPCELYPNGSSAPTLMDIQKTKSKTLQALSVLTNYSHALAAVTNAADRTAYDTAVTQLAGSVANLSMFANAVAPGASTVAPAAVNLMGWIVGTALDEQRYDTLKDAVNAASTAIHTVATTLGIGLGALDDARRMVLYEETAALVKPLNSKLSAADYKQRLAQATTMIGVLDGLRQSDPAATTDSLAKAHDALVAAVNDPSRNYANLLKAMGDFADKASALQAALSAAPKPSGSAKP